MLQDPRVQRLAHTLVHYCCKVKKGDIVAVYAAPVAMPGITAVYEEVLKAGGHPVWMGISEELDELKLRLGSDEQLRHLSPLELHAIKTIDVRIKLWAEENSRAFTTIDPSRQAMASAARKEWLQTFMERESAGGLRWVGTAYPTIGMAQDAEMSLTEYADFVFRAGLLDHPDPAASWRKIRDKQQSLCDWLNTKAEVRFRAPACDGHDGTDLRVSVDGSNWINCAGENNFPDGEVFAGPKGVEGHVNYTFPACHLGREVTGVRLAFKEGRVVDARATKNEDYLLKMLDQDAGARTLGEIAIGTNYAIKNFMRNTLFDEKIGGTFHAAVGAGYPISGNSNQSALHWDMVCDLRPRTASNGTPITGGTIEADGELFHKDGNFLRPEWRF